MADEKVLEKTQKQIELESLNKENAELDKLAEQLGEVERMIQQEKLAQELIPEEVENTLNQMAEERQKKEEEEAKKLVSERDNKKKKLEEDEQRLQEDFSNQIKGSISENTKFFGYIKRYVLIGLVTGIPGIAVAYLFDKWEENRMVKDLYQAHIDMIQNPNNIELERIYNKKKLEFNRVYNIEKIEKLIKESDIIPQIKSDRSELSKLSNEIEKAREIINQKLDEAMEYEARMQEIMQEEQMKAEEQMEELEEEEEIELVPNPPC